jgi:photosystem II stability/assembly factor-like uncharacterized protein
MSSPTTMTLRGIFMVPGGSDGWIVGDSGAILRYQSGLWTIVPSMTGANLRAVTFLDSSHGWAVGTGGAILFFNGNVWTPVTGFTSNNLNSVAVLNPQNAWTVGDSGTIEQWNGVSWYPYTPSPPLVGNPNLNSVSVVSQFGLVVGAQPSPGTEATILQLPGGVIPEFPATVSMVVAVLLLGLFGVKAISRKRRDSSFP